MMGVKVTDEERQAIIEFYVNERATVADTARQFKLAPKTVATILNRADIPRNEIDWKWKPDPDNPSPHEIRLACLEIQSGWTPSQEFAHRVVKANVSHYDRGTVEFPEYVIQESKHKLVGFRLLG